MNIKTEAVIFGDVGDGGVNFLTGGEFSEEFGGHLWQEGTGEDAVDVSVPLSTSVQRSTI